MLVILAGPPSAGKTTFRQKVVELLPNHNIKIVDPSEDLPPDFQAYNEQLKTDYRIAAWSVALEYARALTLEPTETVVIIDTCASKFNPLQPIIADAMVNHHKIAFAFIVANSSECRDRTKTEWIGPEAYTRYIDDFRHSVPEFTQASNFNLVVKNTGSLGRSNLEEAAHKLATFIAGCPC